MKTKIGFPLKTYTGYYSLKNIHHVIEKGFTEKKIIAEFHNK